MSYLVLFVSEGRDNYFEEKLTNSHELIKLLDTHEIVSTTKAGHIEEGRYEVTRFILRKLTQVPLTTIIPPLKVERDTTATPHHTYYHTGVNTTFHGGISDERIDDLTRSFNK